MPSSFPCSPSLSTSWKQGTSAHRCLSDALILRTRPQPPLRWRSLSEDKLPPIATGQKNERVWCRQRGKQPKTVIPQRTANANGKQIHLQSGSFSQTGQFRALRSSSQKPFQVQFVPSVFIHAPFSLIKRVKMDYALFSKSHRQLWLDTQRHHSTKLLRLTFHLRGCLSGILKVIEGAFWREQIKRATRPTFFFFVNPFKFKGFSGSNLLGGVELRKMCQTHSGSAASWNAKRGKKNEAFHPCMAET